MQDSIKISDIASDLGYESEEIIKKALELGIDAKNTTSRVSTEDAEAIFEYTTSGAIPTLIKDRQKNKALAKKFQKVQKLIGDIVEENFSNKTGMAEKNMKNLYIKLDDNLNNIGNDLEKDTDLIYNFLSKKNIKIDNNTIEIAKYILEQCFIDGLPNNFYFSNATRYNKTKNGEKKEIRQVWIRPICDKPFLDNLDKKTFSFRGYINKGFFVINKIKIIPNYTGAKKEIEEEISGVTIYLDKEQSFGSHDLNNKIDQTESIVKKSQEKFEAWLNYLEWRKKIVEQKLIGIKYEYVGFNEEEQIISLRLLATDKKNFNKMEKYLKKGDFDLYDNSYSTNEIDFIYNTNYKHRRNNISILGDLVGNSKKIEVEKNDGLYEYNIDFKINEDLYESYGELIDQETIDELFHNRKNGFLATKEVGDFALISRLKKGIERAFQDESMSPNLLLWLFDITKAEIPTDEEIGKEYEWKNKNLNEEQKKAVKKMLATKDVCLVQGPPGTGKTTVIAEAIYHFVKNNERVLLASQTNLAVDNALERLVKDPAVRAVRLNDSKASDDIEHLKEKNVLGYYFNIVKGEIKDNYLDKWFNDENKINMLNKNILDLKNYSDKLDELDKQINDMQLELQKNNQDKTSIYSTLKTTQEEKDLIKHYQNEINKFLTFLRGENFNFVLKNDFLEEIKKIIMSPLNKIKDDINLDTLNIFYLTNQSDSSRGLKEIYNNLKMLNELKAKFDKLDLNNVNTENIDIINRINEIKDEMPEADPERFLELQREKRELERRSNTFVLREAEKKLFKTYELRLIKNIINTNTHEIEKLYNIFEVEIPELSQSFLHSLNSEENEKAKNIKILEENLKVLDGKILSNQEKLSKFSNNKNEINQKINNIRQDNGIDEDLPIFDSINELEQSLGKIKDSIEGYKFIKENFGDILDNFHRKLSNIDLDNENEYYKDIYISSCNVVGISCTDNPRILEDKGFDTFDVVIIDEVSKATPPELLLPILKSSKVILVGDHRQLPPLFGENERTYKEMVEDLKDNDDEETKQLLTEDNFHKYEKMVTASVFKEYFETAHYNIKHSLLEQFRMHTEIMNVINRFYENRLKSGLSPELEKNSKNHGITIKASDGLNFINPDKHAYWIDSGVLDLNGQTEYIAELKEARSTSTYNIMELYMSVELLKRLDTFYSEKNIGEKVQVGVICLYQLQVNKIRKMIKSISFKYISVDVNTVDRFQGKEKEIIIANLVRTRSNSNHVTAFERINVAFSRAQKALFILGNAQYFKNLTIKMPKMDELGTIEQKVYNNIIELLKNNNSFFKANCLINDKLAKEISEKYRQLKKAESNEKENIKNNDI